MYLVVAVLDCMVVAVLDCNRLLSAVKKLREKL